MVLGYPIIAVPCFRTGGGLDGHPAFFRSIDFLRRCGVNVIYEPEIYPPKNQVPPDVLLDALSEMMNALADGQINSNRKLNKENIRALEH